ncbi:hypothetical protein HK105_200252 [Polyrhizophydium stewartii]|uniref:Uncharacterized protein n=1 Tax=Polyrhizophydium stewartii TaxID=2732419 RepID=A0ABR4NKY8_9FUNG
MSANDPDIPSIEITSPDIPRPQTTEPQHSSRGSDEAREYDAEEAEATGVGAYCAAAGWIGRFWVQHLLGSSSRLILESLLIYHAPKLPIAGVTILVPIAVTFASREIELQLFTTSKYTLDPEIFWI